MATNKLGAAFLRCSLGPLNYAGGLILASNVGEGLKELSVDNLHGGFKRGLGEAAKHVGVPTSEVERLLPMAEIQIAAARLDAAQKGAVAAWSTYAGHIGGLLKGVADLTVDGRSPDVSNFLERLSRKVIRDPPLSEPLHTLSTEVARWLDLVEHCGELLADGGVLAKAYKRRRMRRVIVVAVAGVALAVGLAAIVWVRAVRGRVEAVLAVADPCAAIAIDADDLARASSDQRQRAGERRATCEDEHRREAEALAAQQKREADARAVEQAKKDHEARCDALGERLMNGGDPTSDDDALAPGKNGLLRRIGKRALDRGDMNENDLPCADAPGGQKVTIAFNAAVIASPYAWANADEVSERVRRILLEARGELPPSPTQQLGQHADLVSKRALIQKNKELADQATRLCKLKDDLGIHGAKYCATLAAIRGAGKI